MRIAKSVPFCIAATALLLAVTTHMAVGARPVPLSEVLRAFIEFDPSVIEHQVVRALRLPRALIAIFAGAALGLAGAVVQGVTRNPLADPGILGLLHGGALAVVIGIGVLGLAEPTWIPAFAAAGALASGTIVWGISRAAPGGATPMTLILSGAAVTAFLAALMMIANLLNETAFQSLRIWLTGTLSGSSLTQFYWALPWGVLGAGLSLMLARQITALAIGDDAALGLGINIAKLRLLGLLAVVLLTGAAIAVAGPLGFVGLVVPHVARMLIGADYRYIVPLSALLGALLLVVADIAARTLLAPTEISTGIILAIIGGPVFVWLVRARL